ncbi:MAG: META domain-containing protein [Oceanospirillaceae bacterium]|nr:META domain-containing protein [Oceanospirillaceae bacterium]
MQINATKMLAVIFTSLVISGCVAPVKKTHNALVGTWKITDIQGQKINTDKAMLFFSGDGRVSGNNGCNNITAGYEPYLDHLNLTQLASTKMLCSEPANSEAQAFMQSVEQVEHFLIEGNHLYLTDEQDEVLISLSK